jgi:hypothetical protein
MTHFLKEDPQTALVDEAKSDLIYGFEDSARAEVVGAL